MKEIGNKIVKVE